MRIRRLEPSDLPAVADTAAAAFLDEELFVVICPRRREYYDDFRNNFLRRATHRFYSPEWSLWVAVTDKEDEDVNGNREPGRIVGYAAWERMGKVHAAKRRSEVGWGSWMWSGLQRFIVAVQIRLVDVLGLDRTIDAAAIARFEARGSEGFLPSIFPEMWNLAILAVDPLYQRRGVGKLLLQWGIQQAEAEGVPVGVEASAIGKRLYEKMGFETVKLFEWAEGRWAPTMLWEPEGLGEEESWIKTAKRRADDKNISPAVSSATH